MDDRELAKYYGGGRLAIGILMVLFPGRFMKDVAGGTTRGHKTAGRMIGVRDALLGAGTLAAVQDEKVPLRPWMTYGAIADATDALWFLFAFGSLPKWKRFVLLLMAAAGASTGGYLVTRFED
jgi:hypothetical protein